MRQALGPGALEGPGGSGWGGRWKGGLGLKKKKKKSRAEVLLQGVTVVQLLHDSKFTRTV